MRTLCNLVRMDFYKLCAMRGILILYGGIIILFSIDARTAMVGYMISFYLLLYAPMSYDEQSHGNYLLCSLPVTRKQIVQAKYLYAVLMLLGVDAVVTAVGLIVTPLIPVEMGLISGLSALPTLSMIGTTFTALILPAVLHFGVTKARFLVMGVYVLGCGAVGALNGALRATSQTITFQLSGKWAILLILAVLGASYLIAVELFERRQFTD